MNIQTPSTTESRRFASRIMEAGSKFLRSFPALLAGAGLAAVVLGSAPALAQTYLGTAKPYAVLAGSAVTCTTTATVTGDLGISPNNASSITGPCIINGVTNVAAAAAGAKTDLVTAYDSLAGQACNNNLTGQDLGGLTLPPGVYCFADSAQLTGTLTLDAEGNPDAVFIFQIGSTLTTASNAAVSVINGGVATGCGISWQIGSSATLGTGTDFEGNIVALSTITLNTGAGVSPGRVLARNGAVTLDTGTVSALACVGYGGTGLPPPPGQGSITIVKNTVGGNGTFNFTGAQSFSILTSGGTGSNATAFASVAPGTYDVTETVPAGWSLTALTCSNGSTVTLGTATASVAVAADEAVTCTFTNTLLPPIQGQGSITIVKNTIGGNGTFNFSGAQSFTILTIGDTGSNTTAFASVAPGTYNVTETVPAGWNLTGLTCSNGSTVTLGTATANVAVAADEAVTCTFTNTRQGAIIIVKNAIGGDGTFDFTGAQSFSIATNGGTGSDTTTFASVQPGAYTVTETAQAGWSLAALACSNGGTVNGTTATANVVAGATVICTFTNMNTAKIPIPTLADWALMMLAILLMAAGWLQYRRQR
ncbi:MAG: IPTL-CTERM sorting domain-containing protein [Burkholderiales bacterium]|nr:IPTL-CTERM sorting domain-containing protein [Burkholderiales bacterium]